MIKIETIIKDNFYNILKVSSTATDDIIKSAYIKELLEIDLNNFNEGEKQKFNKLNKSFKNLFNPVLRFIHDVDIRRSSFDSKINVEPCQYNDKTDIGFLDDEVIFQVLIFKMRHIEEEKYFEQLKEIIDMIAEKIYFDEVEKNKVKKLF